MITVFLVDDHALVRAGMRAVLSEHEDITIVGEADSGEACFRTINDLGESQDGYPNIVLLDIRMETGDAGLITAQRIRELSDDISVIICTSFVSDERVTRAVAAGARGYIVKDVSGIDIVLAIRIVAAGFATFAKPAFDCLVESGVHRSQPSAQLTRREREIVSLLGEGHSNHEIAELLFLSEATVKTHTSNLYSKLGVTSRGDAVAAVELQKLLDRRK